ncbi:FimV/HubP family polar landmark protein [Extensimonas sp. H3M7-6]|uniref:FimV/HubP family polar landmark protein n=1 Tax=Extensimonas soli TaxID=3031322 RepID=UPI0023DC564D|nr:FimV/HubP family polar landmark protein [Extensimonas sp. H3M7-6]
MHRWKLSALAAAATLSLGLYSSDASALALGRLSVKSALGEPLRAEIDLPQVTEEEAGSLQTRPASAEVFRAQGVEFSPLMNGVQIVLKRRPDGSAFLLVTSSRTVNDPFLDLVLDASWSAGRLVRNYTILLDPPVSHRAPPEVTAAAQLPAPSSQTAAARATAAGTGPTSTGSSAARDRARPVQPAPASAADTGSITVRPGDTASRIAEAHRPASVSLDQMIVALLRSNPNAFIDGNANRIKAGAVLQLPDEAAAQSVAPAQARQILAAQSRDFNSFRRKLASAAPKTDVAPAQRSASGSVQAVVEDKKPAGAGPDKLLLSKDAAPGQKSAEDQLAKEKQARETSTRVAELSQNIAELNKLNAASAGNAAPAAAAASTAGTASPAAMASAPKEAASGAAIASAGLAPAEQASAASAAAPTASAAPIAAASAPASKPTPAPAPVPESGFVSSLLEEPLLPAAGGLAVLLLGYGAYRVAQQRRKKESLDSSFMESRLQPDSFFGVSGGQRVDTASSDMSTGASSMAYSPSQLDAVGDIDPVAEADVYLAYGRDLQAEEILKEALRHHPERVPVHVKLGEIYAKRQDRKALEAVATEVFKLTQGEGPDWARIADLGRALEPANALYQPGGAPKAATQLGATADAIPSSLPSAFPSTFSGTAEASGAALPELDLNLDAVEPTHAASPATPAPAMSDGPTAALASPHDAQKDAFDLTATASEAAAPPDSGVAAEHFSAAMAEPPVAPAEAAAEAAPQQPAPDAEPMLAELDFSTGDLDLLATAPTPLGGTVETSAPEPMAFDLGDLSLDLDTRPASAEAPTPSTGAEAEPSAQDPLATKLALAQEFHSIGDTEGARELIEEVLAEASGTLKERAQRLLNEIG